MVDASIADQNDDRTMCSYRVVGFVGIMGRKGIIMWKIGRWPGNFENYHTLGYFRTKRAMVDYRNKQIGTDNVEITGTWDVIRIGPSENNDGTLIYRTVSRFEFIGQWADNGCDYTIIGHKAVLS